MKRTLLIAAALARRCPNLTPVNGHGTYVYTDSAGAYPKDAFFGHFVTFLEKISARG